MAEGIPLPDRIVWCTVSTEYITSQRLAFTFLRLNSGLDGVTLMDMCTEGVWGSPFVPLICDAPKGRIHLELLEEI